jgi:hypothetical protein
MLSLNEIKKALYKQKPLAKFEHCMKDARGLHLLYSCEIIDETDSRYEPYFAAVKTLFFRVPVEDIQDAVFDAGMHAQLLIRYLVPPEIIEA